MSVLIRHRWQRGQRASNNDEQRSFRYLLHHNDVLSVAGLIAIFYHFVQFLNNSYTFG